MKRNLVLFCFLLLAATATRAQGRILIQVENFRSDKGLCLIGLYNSSTSFSGKGEPLRWVHATISGRTAEAMLEDVPDGTYAISVVHDANGNRRFDTNFIGIPTEGYGASRNKLPFAAAPKFEDNKFLISGTATIEVKIKLRYLL